MVHILFGRVRFQGTFVCAGDMPRMLRGRLFFAWLQCRLFFSWLQSGMPVPAPWVIFPVALGPNNRS